MSVFVCTGDSAIRLDGEPGSWAAEPVLRAPGAQCVAAQRQIVLVGTRGDGLHLSRDAGASWQHVELPECDVFSVAISPADGTLYAGTEPSRLFASREGGAWREVEALQDIPSRGQWSFPPRPWTHHVRWIAPDPQRAERLLVGIELGGLMYSDDAGATFSDHRPGAKRDTHSVIWHPQAQDRAYQSAGDGAAWSVDGGRSWRAADAKRGLRYCWAIAVDPADPERWYVSAATGPRAAHGGAGARGRLYRWQNSWQELPLPDGSMPYALVATEGQLLAAMSNGRVLASADSGERWEDTDVQVHSVTAMASSA